MSLYYSAIISTTKKNVKLTHGIRTKNTFQVWLKSLMGHKSIPNKSVIHLWALRKQQKKFFS